MPTGSRRYSRQEVCATQSIGYSTVPVGLGLGLRLRGGVRGRGAAAFGLIEVIAILAILVLLALALTPRFIRQMDRAAAGQESAVLQSFADALQTSIKANRAIPNETSWATAIATQLGLEVGQVTANGRRQPRVFLIDPALQVNGGALPYTQTVQGSATLPTGLRFLLVSSLSPANPLPAQLVSGVGQTSGAYSFANLWGTTEGTVPIGWVWSGAGADLAIQRIDLNGLFVRVGFVNEDAIAPYYSVDGSTNCPVLVPGVFLLRSAQLNLLNASQVLEYSEILQRSVTFTYKLGTWRGDGLRVGMAQPGPAELQEAVNVFMRAPLNPCAQAGVQKRDVYNAMISYMSNFVTWRNNGYPPLGSGEPMLNDQVNLASVTVNIINAH